LLDSLLQEIYVVSLEEENYEMEMRRVLKDECSEN